MGPQTQKLFLKRGPKPRNYFLNESQDGAQSMEVQKTIRSMKKELGLEPFGDLKPYSRTECPPQVSHALNKREKTSLDINAALLEETCLFNLGLMNGSVLTQVFSLKGTSDWRFKFNLVKIPKRK